MANPASASASFDPYEPRPTLWQRHPHLAWSLAVFVATATLTFVSFPPVGAGDAAFAMLIPAALWAYRAPPFRIYAWTLGASQIVAWLLLLEWLRHVSWVGLFLLAPFVGVIATLWFLAARWTLPRLLGRPALVRIVGMMGLSALWVLIEWFRGWIFGGFPWLPLAASQWKLPIMLQMTAYVGAWGISFVLVAFNVGAAAYAHRAFFEGATGLKKRSPEFSVGLLILMASTFPLIGDTFGQRRQPLMKTALVQPYIPQGEKWDPARAHDVLATIARLTVDATDGGNPDVILWPEAVMPWAVHHDPAAGEWLAAMANRTARPLVAGTVFTDSTDEHWFNGAYVINPGTGLQEPPYAKRKLVPFGEYVPLRPVLGWIEKFAPIGGDFTPGDSEDPLVLKLRSHAVKLGMLICYEDIFPSLARSDTRAGADVLTVITNNGWFGEGGAAYQHAAHSVLRAAENRRPVIRCGNGGWSGWIDEYGTIRSVMLNEDHSVYFRGFESMMITTDTRWTGRLSLYTRLGDWFVPLCAGIATFAYFLVLMSNPPRREAA
ncbi:MAG TPA: apolipoprotein N-acyltransferase [Candidatus Didemnitutus sp.]|nr:apolipoprotein N-acyltransferase [Candidatus Didemnitutus sp.]